MSYQHPNLLAAVDIGSNSIHLTLAKAQDAGFQIIKRVGRKAQLAAGLNAKRTLSNDAIARGLSILEEIALELQKSDSPKVAIVATCALRQATNRDAFIVQAEQILGHPIRVIEGAEEARLIYLGAAKASPFNDKQLVIDIGGGSTELIIGQGSQPLLLNSLDLGCIHFSQHFFANGEIRPEGFSAAIESAKSCLEKIRASYLGLGWAHCIGTSGTAQAAMQVLRQQGSALSLQGLTQLRQQLCTIGHIRHIDLAGLKPDRRSIFVGGVAILLALFDSLELDTMHYVDSALREGLLWDMLQGA